MEAGLSQAALSLYHSVSGNLSYTPKEVCEEFAKTPIDKPLSHNSGLFGKVPTDRHILEDQIYEESIDELIKEM